ncbi:hypothetical protein H4S08_000051 [Coemansia sp. RSA 1365]|nr:hypothetical protein H4S08_000051 [Coemansia sp. RSA 1365]
MQRQKQNEENHKQQQQKEEPSTLYLAPQTRRWEDTWALADYEANERNTTHKQLIVLDLNGTLLCRGPRVVDRLRSIKPRPYLDEFMDFALENFAVMVWSSTQPGNINEMLRKTLSPHWKKFVRVWDRRFCELDGVYFGKSKSVKDLARICDGFSLEDSPNRNIYGTYDGYKGICSDMKGHWTLENTIIVDDSESKTALQKDNHVFVKPFEILKSIPKVDESTDKELLKLKQYLTAYLEQKEPRQSLVSYLKEHPWLEFRNSVDTT